jgi:hypothetical protein
VTIAGDTSGTWLTTNGIGIRLLFSLGSGTTLSGTAGAWAGANYTSATGAVKLIETNSATFYITGVQLEKGSTATSFDYRPYGTELALCQRYYYRIKPSAVNTAFGVGQNDSTANSRGFVAFAVSMRTAPSALEQSGTAGDYGIEASAGGGACTSVPTFSSASIIGSKVIFVKASTQTAGQSCLLQTGPTTGVSAFLAWSAEL